VHQDERILRLRDRDVARCVKHPRHPGRQARHVRIDVFLPVFFPLRERPRLIWDLPVRRIDNPGRSGIDVPVAGMLLDVLDPTALAAPEPLQVRLTIRCARRDERFRLGEGTRMEGHRITGAVVWSRRLAAPLRLDDERGGSHGPDDEPDDVIPHDQLVALFFVDDSGTGAITGASLM
jgi:hypothetical protein